LNYANRFAADIKILRQRGVQFTSPLLRSGPPGVTAANLNEFYTACGSQCRNRTSPAYINVNAVNVFIGPWNAPGIQGCRDGANYMTNEVKAYYPTDNRPWYITNWSRLGTYNTSDQVDAMKVIGLFFEIGSPIQRIYWFGATDYGGNSGNNFLTQKTGNGQTLGQIWRSNCDAL
jgi:Glycosyl hydrolase catalytic core